MLTLIESEVNSTTSAVPEGMMSLRRAEIILGSPSSLQDYTNEWVFTASTKARRIVAAASSEEERAEWMSKCIQFQLPRSPKALKKVNS